MIAEIIPEAYDALGKQVSQPFLRRRGLRPTFPMGRYVSQPLAIHCQNIEEVRQFLRTCRVVSDEALFGKREYWQPPEEFERRKAGDCEDFSLWTWRQLMALGFDARMVFGRHGRYGIGHAWVEFLQEGKCFLVEPQARSLGLHLPRLSTLAYDPMFSVAWDVDEIRYYAHKKPDSSHLSWIFILRLIPEWVSIWGWFWLRVVVRLPYLKVKNWLKRSRKKD
jgi:Bacterial transglutaminase-like cysteine proteinase BTLCP